MNPQELFKKGLQEICISCTGQQIMAFMTYLSELKKWNRTYNLTALKTDEDIVIKHFIDSLLYVKVLPEGVIKLADVGTGAGFPGIPIKIIKPDIEISLIESSRKKSAFLRHIVRVLKLSNIAILEQRVENLGREYEKTFDVIVTRATFPIKEFLEKGCPFLRDNGRLILNKGPNIADELDELNKSPYGDAVRSIHEYKLPVINAVRNLIVLGC